MARFWKVFDWTGGFDYVDGDVNSALAAVSGCSA
jgi:hypothetical protein